MRPPPGDVPDPGGSNISSFFVAPALQPALQAPFFTTDTMGKPFLNITGPQHALSAGSHLDLYLFFSCFCLQTVLRLNSCFSLLKIV